MRKHKKHRGRLSYEKQSSFDALVRTAESLILDGKPRAASAAADDFLARVFRLEANRVDPPAELTKLPKW